MASRKTGLAVKISGRDVTPENVDSILLLRLAQATLRLATKIADAEQLGLSLSGLSVVGGSCALVSIPSNLGSARVAVDRALRVVHGERDAPRGTEQLAEDVRVCLRELPSGHSAMVEIGKWKRAYHPVPVNESASGIWERTDLRVRPTRVGGTGYEPTARLESRSEGTSFVVAVSEDDARILGASLYRDVDVELEICRNGNGQIERGRILKINPLSTAEPIVAWRTWFKENASEWEDVDDVGVALGRYD